MIEYGLSRSGCVAERRLVNHGRRPGRERPRAGSVVLDERHALAKGLERSNHPQGRASTCRIVRATFGSLLASQAPCSATCALPRDITGGDLYDFNPLEADSLAIAIADAAGHGLLATLQARDVATGLRMGVERDFKIIRTIEKLNRVIHRSGLSSRFVSLVFGELESNGNFAYINAGHPPPLLLDDHGLQELTVGGMLFGPFPDATNKMGFAHVDRGAVLVLYTDGILERGAESGHPFGATRLLEWLNDWRDGSARDAVADLIAHLRSFGAGSPFEDDVTAIFVRRPRSVVAPR